MGTALTIAQQQGIAIGVLSIAVLGLASALVAMWKSHKTESRQHYADLLGIIKQNTELEVKTHAVLDTLVQQRRNG